MTQQFNFNHHCEKLLVESKRRDGDRVARRLEVICGALNRAGHEAVQTKLGGSVEKRTYVSGLSDVDVLLIVNQTPLKNQRPSRVMKHVRGIIKRQFPKNRVKAGKLAVTVNFRKGPEMQVLPAIRTNSSGIRIAQHGSSKWSNVVISDNFTRKLTKVNRDTDGRAVSVIKLAKAMADCHIKCQERKISGYHMEALAVDAFDGYDGATDTKSMLIHFLGHSMDAVLNPIDDSTLQTPHVDGYLGSANSLPRKGASTHFGQMRGNVRSCETRADFNKLFGL